MEVGAELRQPENAQRKSQRPPYRRARSGSTYPRGASGNIPARPGGLPLRRIPRPRRAPHTRPNFSDFSPSTASGLGREADFPDGKRAHPQRGRPAAPRISASLLVPSCTCSFLSQPPSVPPRTYPAPPPSNLPNLLVGVARIFTWLTATSAVVLFVYYVRNGLRYSYSAHS